jgi:hypothetical protein
MFGAIGQMLGANARRRSNGQPERPKNGCDRGGIEFRTVALLRHFSESSGDLENTSWAIPHPPNFSRTQIDTSLEPLPCANHNGLKSSHGIMALAQKSFRINAEEWAKFKRIATSRGECPSAVLRGFAQRYVRDRGRILDMTAIVLKMEEQEKNAQFP